MKDEVPGSEPFFMSHKDTNCHTTQNRRGWVGGCRSRVVGS